MSEPKLSKGYTEYGAFMGRADSNDCDAETPIRLRCYRMRLDSGGYDNGGAYWGSGSPLFRVIGEHSSEFGVESLELFIRASSRLEAIGIVRKAYPNARFYGSLTSPVLHACDGSGRLNLELPEWMVCKVPRSGAADSAIASLMREPIVMAQVAQWSDADLVRALDEYGCWEASELADRTSNVERMLWLLIGDIQEGAAS